jgi:hypothetical protein
MLLKIYAKFSPLTGIHKNIVSLQHTKKIFNHNIN